MFLLKRFFVDTYPLLRSPCGAWIRMGIRPWFGSTAVSMGSLDPFPTWIPHWT